MKEERRKFLRLEAHHLLKYKMLNKKRALSFARNISAGGVLFHSKDEMPPGSDVELVINFPSFPHPISVVARIIHIKPLKKLGGFYIGAEFIHINEQDRDYIEKKISGVLGEKKRSE
jgi:c-di-GMP-binding flagellar brake protein YcgR